VELVGHENAPWDGDVRDAVRQVHHRPVVVPVLDEHRADGECHPDVRQQLVVGVRLCQSESDVRGGRRRLGDEHHLVPDHLDDTPSSRGDDVVCHVLEPADQGRELLLRQLLAEHREPDHVGETD